MRKCSKNSSNEHHPLVRSCPPRHEGNFCLCRPRLACLCEETYGPDKREGGTLEGLPRARRDSGRLGRTKHSRDSRRKLPYHLPRKSRVGSNLNRASCCSTIT